MTRSPVFPVLLFASSAALVAAACGGNTNTPEGSGGGTQTGSGGSAAMTNTTGGSSGTAGAPVTGSGGSTGGTGGGSGGTGATGGTTGGTTGGGPAAGGTTGGTSGGSAGSGVVGGSGGLPGTGGAAGSGMMMGGAGTGAGGTGSASCTITSMATQSTAIPTVFTVTYTTSMTGVDSAHIDFGLDTTYGYTAPVDLTDTKGTLLLGMKPSKPYHYRVVVSSGGNACNGPDQTIMTGAIANGIPKATITTNNAAGLAGGFIVSEWYAGKQIAFILDKDNDVVWWFDPKTVVSNFSDLTRARMSNDGKYMYIAHGNVPEGAGANGGAHMVKVAMDGTGATDLSSSFANMNHDFTILPDDTMYFVAYGTGGATCDDIKQYVPSTGMTTTVMNIGKAFTSGMCHGNAIEYSKEDDTLIWSDPDHNAYVKIKRTGEIIWVLGGGSDNDFTGDAATWTTEHNLDVLGANHILMFNNDRAPNPSNAIELQLDTTAKTATKLWEYTPTGVQNNAIMGDVQRLPNGNTLVTYSTQGVIHQVDMNKTLLQSISWGAGGATGYAIWRPTLYGPPPK